MSMPALTPVQIQRFKSQLEITCFTTAQSRVFRSWREVMELANSNFHTKQNPVQAYQDPFVVRLVINWLNQCGGDFNCLV